MEPVKDHQGMKIIGIDNGYGNIKTANCCFPAGLTAHDAEPVFKDDLLVYDGRYYLIGTGHKEFKADKTGDDDYYILTLAAIARELNVYGLTDATVYLAVGLPLTWVSRQREDFKAYLTRNRELAFTFRGKAYRVEIAGVDVFPQGFAAVAGQIRDFQGVNMLCDIGNGTMNIMFINDRKPVVDRMFTEKYGTHQCMLAVRENVMRTHHATVDESIINRVLRFGTADIREDYLTTIRETAAEYVGEIFRILREHEYNPALMRLHVLGGGSCLVRNFGAYDADRVTIYEDICATAKGYERMKLKRFSLRFNLDREDDRRAWEALHRMDTRSINQEIIARINAKEQTDVLKELIRQTVSEELERTAKNSRDRPAAQAEASAEDLNTVFDFLNSF